MKKEDYEKAREHIINNKEKRKMNNYSKGTLNSWSKKDLVEYILCLQHNIKNEDFRSNHIFKTMQEVMERNPDFSELCGEVLKDWNKTGGNSYHVQGCTDLLALNREVLMQKPLDTN